MTLLNVKKHAGSGFFARILASLLIVNIATIGILVFVTYFQNTASTTKRTQENIQQQVAILADKFEEQYRNALERSLRTLINSPTLNDYLLGSDAERLVLARRLEREYLRHVADYPFIQSISYIDDEAKVAISVENGVRRSDQTDLSDLQDSSASTQWKKISQLYRDLKSVPLLLFSGNMEWFMPPREPSVVGPFTDANGIPGAAIGSSKLDTNTGTFAGVIIIHFSLATWFEELKNVRFFDESVLWLFDSEQQILIKPGDAALQLDPRPTLNDGVTQDIELKKAADGLIVFTDLTLGPAHQFLRLTASIPTDLLLLDHASVFEFFTAVLFGSIILLTLISYSVSRYLAQPVAALHIAQNRLANAQRIARLGHWEWNANSSTLLLSARARVILGLDPDSKILTMSEFIDCAHPDDREALNHVIQQVIRTGVNDSIEHRASFRDGLTIAVYQDIEVENGPERRVIGTIQDISLRKKAEEKIQRLAYYDVVTDLPNRTLLNQRAKEAIQRAELTQRGVGFLFLDLDHFKRINDTFGHDAGDELLSLVADRLRECVRLTDAIGSPSDFESSGKTVARLGGDEFIIVVENLEDHDAVEIIAARISALLTNKFTIGGKDVFLTGSLGVSVYPDHGDTVDELLRHADAAMYHAKNKGRNRFEFFTSSIEQEIHRRFSLETRLHQAIEKNEFILHYQPRVDIRTGQIVALEALVRWLDPDEGIIGPDQFIPIAEETGLIIPIGEWVLREACRQLAQWRRLVDAPITMSINLSPVQFKAPNLLRVIRNAIEAAGIEPDWIELELTENALFEDIDASVRLANEFKTLGVRLSIDDFGTGYSSLQQLKRFPVDLIKIDRTFIRDVLTDTDGALIVKTAISLGHNLRLRVVAEGVENAAQLAFLRKYKCDEAQGFSLGKPKPANDIVSLLLTEDQVRFSSSIHSLCSA